MQFYSHTFCLRPIISQLKSSQTLKQGLNYQTTVSSIILVQSYSHTLAASYHKSTQLKKSSQTLKQGLVLRSWNSSRLEAEYQSINKMSQNDNSAIVMMDTKNEASSGSDDELPFKIAPQFWLQALYHITASVFGAPSVVALPFPYAYLGWTGSKMLLLISAVVSSYSAFLIISLQSQ